MKISKGADFTNFYYILRKMKVSKSPSQKSMALTYKKKKNMKDSKSKVHGADLLIYIIL
jgi:hypothetical protein